MPAITPGPLNWWNRGWNKSATSTVSAILKAVLGLGALLAGWGVLGLAAGSIALNLITLAVLWLTGKEINTIVLTAIILALGMLVDQRGRKWVANWSTAIESFDDEDGHDANKDTHHTAGKPGKEPLPTAA